VDSGLCLLLRSGSACARSELGVTDIAGTLGEVLVLWNAADVLRKEGMRNVMQLSAAWPMKAGVVSVCEKGCQCISYIQSVGLGSSHDWSRRLGSGQYCWQCTARLVRRLSILL
jgi:hypothetical protein